MDIFEIFQQIYDKNHWGYGSGSGSRPIFTVEYRQFLQNFFKTHQIKSVLDYGCGDWQFSKLINWDNISYHGIDVAPKIITTNQKLYSRDNIKFSLNKNFDIPIVDLIIIKDVVQHLPNLKILSIIDDFSKYHKGHILWVNDMNENRIKNNKNIEIGQYRTLDLSMSPFNLKGEILFKFPNRKLVFWTKSN